MLCSIVKTYRTRLEFIKFTAKITACPHVSPFSCSVVLLPAHHAERKADATQKSLHLGIKSCFFA